MAQTIDGALKVAAKKCGIEVDAYLAMRESGLKHCWKCKQWKAINDFSLDRSRFDGYAAGCKPCTRVQHKKERKLSRPSIRHGNRASEAVRQAIKKGVLQRPEERSCTECGNSARHYHHHLGYSDEHLLDVVPMCVGCHQKVHWDG